MAILEEYVSQVNAALSIVPRKLSIFVGLCYATGLFMGVVWYRSFWLTLGFFILSTIVSLAVTIGYMKYKMRTDPIGTMMVLAQATMMFKGKQQEEVIDERKQ
jgi:hypothetical protein